MKFDLTTILVAILAILILCIAFMKKSAPVSEGFRRRAVTRKRTIIPLGETQSP
jgi:hypothetical protein